MTTYPIPEEDYAALFRQNVLRSVQALLTRTHRETTLGLTEAARTRTFTMLDYAFHLSESWPTLGELLRLLAPKFDLAGYRVQWLPYLEKGVAASVTQRDDKTEAVLTCELGLIHQRLGKLDTAQALLERACNLAREQDERSLLCLALQRLAEIARLRRRYQECEALLDEAKALFAPDHSAQAYGLFVAGKAAFDQHSLAAATAAFTQAMEIWQAEGNPGRAALCIQNLGRTALPALSLLERTEDVDLRRRAYRLQQVIIGLDADQLAHLRDTPGKRVLQDLLRQGALRPEMYSVLERELMTAAQRQTPNATLIAVFGLYVNGLSRSDIANRLGCSLENVRNYITIIYQHFDLPADQYKGRELRRQKLIELARTRSFIP